MTEKTISVLAAPALRARLNHLCKEHVRGGFSLSKFESNISYLYRQYWRRSASFDILEDELTVQKAPYEEVEHVFALFRSDYNRVILEASALAWLTIDNSRLHDEFKDTSIPEDLNYGLVLQYYKPVIRTAAFLSGLTYEEEREVMPDLWVQDAHKNAVQNLTHKYPKLTKEQIEDRVKNILM